MKAIVVIYIAFLLFIIGGFVYAQRNGLLYTNSDDTEKFAPNGSPNSNSYGSNRHHGSYYRYHK